MSLDTALQLLRQATQEINTVDLKGREVLNDQMREAQDLLNAAARKLSNIQRSIESQPAMQMTSALLNK